MVDVPQAGGGHMPRSHMATSGNAAAAADAEEAWQRTQRLERVSARVLARAEVSAERVRELAAAAAGSWAAAAANHGDASSDATVHPDNARAQEAAPAPEAAIPKWKAISMGFGIATEISGGVKQLKQDQADFLANVTAVGGEFLTELVAELNESVATAQSEILAANVPLASYGRVKDALDRVRGAPTRHASEHNALLPFAHILCPCPCPCAWPRRSCSSLTHACEVCSLKALLVIGLASCWAYPCRRFEQMCLKD